MYCVEFTRYQRLAERSRPIRRELVSKMYNHYYWWVPKLYNNVFSLCKAVYRSNSLASWSIIAKRVFQAPSTIQTFLKPSSRLPLKSPLKSPLIYKYVTSPVAPWINTVKLTLIPRHATLITRPFPGVGLPGFHKTHNSAAWLQLAQSFYYRPSL